MFPAGYRKTVVCGLLEADRRPAREVDSRTCGLMVLSSVRTVDVTPTKVTAEAQHRAVCRARLDQEGDGEDIKEAQLWALQGLCLAQELCSLALSSRQIFWETVIDKDLRIWGSETRQWY